MKSTLLFMLFTAVSIISYAQISKGGEPISWQTDKLDLSDLRFVEMSTFNESAMRAEDDINNATKDVPFRFGKNFDTHLSLNNWDSIDLPNGDKLSFLAVESAGAYSLNFLIEDFFIPEGASLFIYSEDHSYKIGAFTSENNNAENTLPTYPLPGDKIILEYHEPSEVLGQGRMVVTKVTHAYRDLDIIARGIGDSGTCNNNVVCPEGAPWQDQINSVAMVVVGSNGICSGALINNTANDGHPYFLTADHCTGGGVTNWVFRFNWQSPTCGDNNPAQNTIDFQTVSGSTMLAQGNAADYALLEINNGNPIPLAYNPYYAGWDATGNTPLNSTGIHHPAGDLKKISFDDDAAGTAPYGGATTWQVFDWEDGTTEGGSSGSPLFDQNKRIVGQLFGGQASCGFNVNDYYGKFDITYPNVCNWLAPGCNTLILDGYDPAGPAAALDLQVLSIADADGNYCVDNITPTVTIRNAGTDAINSFDLNYDVDGANGQTLSWTGTLNSGSSVDITLPTISGITTGSHTFNASTNSPNGAADQDTSNDSGSSSFSTVVGGTFVTLDILTDNYPEENTWQIIEQGSGNVVISGGPYPADQTVYSESICLGLGCYELVFFDSFGDGMQYEGVVGNYELTDADGNTLAEIVAGGNFGSQANDPFCLTATSVEASFSSSDQTVCIGESINFTDSSTGGPTSWNWTFNGGTPSSSTAQNPTITYNTAGTYSVTLTADNGSANDTETLTNYITVSETTYYLDSDNDGYGDSAFAVTACSAPLGFVDVDGDCEPLNGDVYPGAQEICDGLDNNCDGNIDEGFTQITYYLDEDGDGYGTDDQIQSCLPVGDYTATENGDCNDDDANINPMSPEICGNSVDDNCNDQIDENINTYYTDSDNDGYGDPDSPVQACNLSAGLAANNLDCDDTRDDVNPVASGTMEGIDNDCDGEITGDEILPQCPADLDNNGMVNIQDLTALLADIGCTFNCSGDMDGNGATTTTDVSVFLSYFGQTCN